MVDQERLLLNGCVGYKPESGNLVRGQAKVFQSRERHFRCSHSWQILREYINRMCEICRTEESATGENAPQAEAYLKSNSYVISNLEKVLESQRVQRQTRIRYCQILFVNFMDNATPDSLCIQRQPDVMYDKALERAKSCSVLFSSCSNPFNKP